MRRRHDASTGSRRWSSTCESTPGGPRPRPRSEDRRERRKRAATEPLQAGASLSRAHTHLSHQVSKESEGIKPRTRRKPANADVRESIHVSSFLLHSCCARYSRKAYSLYPETPLVRELVAIFHDRRSDVTAAQRRPTPRALFCIIATYACDL